MNPAPSVIVFTVLSGFGFGLLACLGLTGSGQQGWAAFVLWALGYGPAVAGLLASTFHLGHPERAWRAFSQWRTSWLSREGVAAVATLVWFAPMALAEIFGLGWPRLWGGMGAVLALGTVFTTSMIYAQLKTVPRWNHWLVPVLFMTFALVAAAAMSGNAWVLAFMLVVLGVLMPAYWRSGDRAFAARAQTLGAATGLGEKTRVQVFEAAHSHPNYLMREMIHEVGRKHAERLRAIGWVLAVGLPLLLTVLLPGSRIGLVLAMGLHLVGAAVQRWLFFAEAEHVVGLYYGRHGGGA